jgi:hypothetical protein
VSKEVALYAQPKAAPKRTATDAQTAATFLFHFFYADGRFQRIRKDHYKATMGSCIIKGLPFLITL